MKPKRRVPSPALGSSSCAPATCNAAPREAERGFKFPKRRVATASAARIGFVFTYVTKSPLSAVVANDGNCVAVMILIVPTEEAAAEDLGILDAAETLRMPAMLS
jgi:hypothetical protein